MLADTGLFQKLLDDFDVSGEPVNVPDLFDVEPAHIFVRMLLEFARFDFCEIALHREVERFIVMLDGAEILEVTDGDLEFFFNFANDSLLAGLARLQLAAGELPSVFKLAVTTLAAEYLVSVADNRCCYVNGLHDNLLHLDV